MARRVHGPYKHGSKWRLITVGNDGKQHAGSYESEREALDEKERIEQGFQEERGITVIQALDKYELYQRGKGNKPRSVETTRGRITRLLAAQLTRPLASVSSYAAAKAYADLQPLVSADYHRNALNETKTFFRWCMAKPRQWIKRMPFAEVKGEGRRKKGKPQHRVDESRRFMIVAFQRAEAGHLDGVVAIASLFFGTRISELVDRPVRDLDDDGRLLWIPDSKTESGRRFIDVPDALRTFLVALAKDKLPEARLFGALTRHQARRMVLSVCKLASVPEVGPHGLRGTHVSLARERGATSQLIAAAVGHSSYEAVTARHYVAPGTDERVQARTTMAVLQGGKRGN
jgi:integrase